MLVWRHGSTLQPCKCPLCRRPISLLVPTEDTIRNRSDSSVSEVLANLETYNRYFGGRSTSLIQVIYFSMLALLSQISLTELLFLLPEDARSSLLTSKIVARNDGFSKNPSSCHQSSSLYRS